MFRVLALMRNAVVYDTFRSMDASPQRDGAQRGRASISITSYPSRIDEHPQTR
jgi:hypothetical protein